MADSFTPLLNLRLQQTGGNTNTWGDLLNTDAITPLENAVAGVSTHAVTGGALDLSATPLVHQVHKFTGVLTSDLTVTIPNLAKTMKVHNATSGAFLMVIKTASGTATCIPQGTIKEVYCDGSNGVFRSDLSDVGEVTYYATGGGTDVPGKFECDGRAVSRTMCPELFAAIGTIWGAGNGSTTFNLPDLKTAGRFIRSRSGSVSIATFQNADIAPHNHTASAGTNVSLSIAGDGAWTPSISIGDPGHAHTYTVSSGPAPFTSSGAGSLFFTQSGATTSAAATGITASSTGIGNHAHAGSSASATTNVTVNNSTGTETRPVNVSMLACIRY